MGDFVDENHNETVTNGIQQLENLLMSLIKSNIGNSVFQSLENDAKKEVYGYIQLLKGLVMLSILENYTETQLKLALKELWTVNLVGGLISPDQQSQFIDHVNYIIIQ